MFLHIKKTRTLHFCCSVRVCIGVSVCGACHMFTVLFLFDHSRFLSRCLCSCGLGSLCAFGLCAFGSRLSLLNAYEFNGEYKCGVRFDFACLTCSVTQFLRYVELPLTAYRHHGEGFGSSLDHLVGSECGGVGLAFV